MFRKLEDHCRSPLTIYIDGQPVEAEPGETVAGVILRQPDSVSRTTPVHESPRAPFCMMGVCFDCLVIVDGVGSTQSCLIPVQQGMRVERQFGRRRIFNGTKV